MKFQLVAILGTSGAGKSTLIRRLVRECAPFRYVRPYTTRPLRHGETEKIRVLMDEMLALQRDGQLLVLQKVFGNWYGTPLLPIHQANEAGFVPIIDWPVQRLADLKAQFSGQVTAVYVIPPSEHALRCRLEDGRDPDGTRFRLAIAELKAVRRGDYQGLIDMYIQSDTEILPPVEASLSNPIHLSNAAK